MATDLRNVLTSEERVDLAPVERAAFSEYLDRVNDALRDNLVALFDDLTGDRRTNRSTREGRWRGNSGNQSVSVILTGARAGTWFDHGADTGSRYPLQAIRHFWGLDLRAALDEAADRSGLPRYDAKAIRRESAEKLAKDRAARERKRAEKEAKAAEEDAKKLRDDILAVGEIIRSTVPVDGTIGERYLKETREIEERRAAVPVKSWPASIRWSPKDRALVFVVTNAAGDHVGVQFVAVDAAAKKDDARYGKAKAKISRGPIGLGSVKFPATVPGGPVLFAEGPETGLSAWMATGYETRVVLGAGGFKRIINEAPRDRKILLLRDDDATNNRAYKAAIAGLMSLSNAGFDAWDVWPSDDRRQDGSDLNNVLISDGADAVAERIVDAMSVQSTAHRIEYDIARAERLVDRRVAEFFADAANRREGEPPIVRALGVDTGVGKTHSAIKNAVKFVADLRAANDLRAVALLVPEHRLGQEVVERVRAEIERAGVNLTVSAWRGREAKRPGAENDLDRMCINLDGPDGVKAAGEVLADIEAEVCAVCPHKDDCAYLKQRDQRADLWIGSHQLMFRAAPTAIGSLGIAALVVDEDMLPAGVRAPFEMPISALSAMATPRDDDDRLDLLDLRHRLENILAAAPDGFLRRDELSRENCQIDSSAVANAIELEWSRKVERKVERDWRLRHANKDLMKAVSLWRAVADLARDDGPAASGFISIGRDRETNAKIVRVSHRAAIHPDWCAPTLIIDAMHNDAALLQFFWPAVEDLGRVNVSAPYQRIAQVVDRAYSMSFLEPPRAKRRTAREADDAVDDKVDAKVEETARRNAKHRREVVAAIVRMHRENGGKTLVVANKSVAQSPEFARLASLFPADRAISVAWFGAMAGRDEWRDVRTLITVGRPLPSPRAVETMAATLTGVGVETLVADGSSRRSGWYVRERGERLRRIGRRDAIRLPAETDCHPDQMVERLRRDQSTGGLMQAIGRGRGTRRTAETPLDVVVMSDAILPIPVDEFLIADDLALSVVDMQIAAGGVAFETGACAAAAYPELWATDKAFLMAKGREQEASARDNVNRPVCDNTVTKSYSTTYRRLLPCSGKVDGLHSVEFQLSGPKQRRQFATYDPAICGDVRAFLDQHVGPVEWIAFAGDPVAEPIRLPMAVGAEGMIPVAPPDPDPPPASKASPMSLLPPADPLPAQDNAQPEPEPLLPTRARGAEIVVAVDPGPVVEPVEEEIEAVDPPARAVVKVRPGLWEEVWRHARACGLRHCDVAERVGSSACHLSNVESERRNATTELIAGLERFLAEAKPIQETLF